MQWFERCLVFSIRLGYKVASLTLTNRRENHPFEDSCPTVWHRETNNEFSGETNWSETLKSANTDAFHIGQNAHCVPAAFCISSQKLKYPPFSRCPPVLHLLVSSGDVGLGYQRRRSQRQLSLPFQQNSRQDQSEVSVTQSGQSDTRRQKHWHDDHDLFLPQKGFKHFLSVRPHFLDKRFRLNYTHTHTWKPKVKETGFTAQLCEKPFDLRGAESISESFCESQQVETQIQSQNDDSQNCSGRKSTGVSNGTDSSMYSAYHEPWHQVTCPGDFSNVQMDKARLLGGRTERTDRSSPNMLEKEVH